MANAGNAGFMIPEQVWDSADGKGKFVFGKGTDSATPLAWSMAQFVRLAVSSDAGQPVERPSVVASRYALGRTGTITFTVTVPPNTDSTSKSVFLAGELDRLDPPRPVWDAAGVRLTRVDSTHWQGTLTGRMGTTVEYKYALGDWAFVEKSASCAELSNRMLTLSFGASGTQAVNESVAAWRNVPPCGN